MIVSFADKATEMVWLRDPSGRCIPMFSGSPTADFNSSAWSTFSRNFECRPATGSKRYGVIAAASTAFVSISSGAFVSRGRTPDRKELRSLTTTKAHEPIHPGEILREDFLIPMELSAYALAKAIGVPESRLSVILNGRRSITADTGLRLSRYFGLGDHYWTRLQESYDVAVARDAIEAELDGIVPMSSV